MALFKKPEQAKEKSVAGAREISISMRCDVCGVAIPKSIYIPAISMLKCVCENGHETIIEDFGLDLM